MSANKHPLELLIAKAGEGAYNRISFSSMGHNAFYHEVEWEENPFGLDTEAGKYWDHGWWQAWEGWHARLWE